MEEIWLPIKDYEGLYEVSNLGKVKSVERIVNSGKNQKRIVRERIINQNEKVNYLYVQLSKNCVTKGFRVHRLVAIAFLNNPNNKQYVNHIDGNKKNNYVNNLEWCSPSENSKHMYKIKLKVVPVGAENHRSKSVKQYDKKNNYIKTWGCLSDVNRELKIDISNISACALGKIPYAGGFVWKY